LLLRSGTQGETGLESVHRSLWGKYPVSAGGYTAQNVKGILGELLEHDWEGFWREYVAGTQELPLEELLRTAGLELRSDADKEEAGSPEAWWGLKVRDGGADQFAVVTEVERDGPAWKAGIASQDMLAALDGLRVSAKDFAGRSAALTNGPVRVTFFRRDELREVTATPELREKGKRKLKPVEEVSDEQKRVNTSWLSTPWPE
jgi:predicted metalloprotease with PDZ domain